MRMSSGLVDLNRPPQEAEYSHAVHRPAEAVISQLPEQTHALENQLRIWGGPYSKAKGRGASPRPDLSDGLDGRFKSLHRD